MINLGMKHPTYSPFLSTVQKLVFVLLVASNSLYAQKTKLKVVSKELLQGTWASAENNGALKYEFNGSKFSIFERDSVLYECNDFQLKDKTLDTNCKAEEKLIFKIRSVNDSILYMKASSTDYYHKYTKVVKK